MAGTNEDTIMPTPSIPMDYSNQAEGIVQPGTTGDEGMAQSDVNRDTTGSDTSEDAQSDVISQYEARRGGKPRLPRKPSSPRPRQGRRRRMGKV